MISCEIYVNMWSIGKGRREGGVLNERLIISKGGGIGNACKVLVGKFDLLRPLRQTKNLA